MKIPSHGTLGIIAFVTGIPAICLLILPYHLFPEYYIPKTVGLGYTSPATIEGWVFMISGLALLAIAIVCTLLRRRM